MTNDNWLDCCFVTLIVKALSLSICIFNQFYLLPRLIGDTGTPQLCLRDVDMDLTRIGKLSRSGSPSVLIVDSFPLSPDFIVSFSVSIDPKSPFRLILKLSPTSDPEVFPLSTMQRVSAVGLS